jgi:hypothetical protein
VAESLNTGKEIEFADGQKVLIKPLTIRQLRKFMKVIQNLSTDMTTINDEEVDNMVEAASIALEKAAPELAADRDALEDALDMRCFNELISVAMGADPNE